MSVEPGLALTPGSLWKSWLLAVRESVQGAGLSAVRPAWSNRAAEVMIFMVEPGDLMPLMAMSPSAPVCAIARMWPLLQSSATVPAGLFCRWASVTACSATVCMRASIVVLMTGVRPLEKTSSVFTPAPAPSTTATPVPTVPPLGLTFWRMVAAMSRKEENVVRSVLPSLATTFAELAPAGSLPAVSDWPSPRPGYSTELFQCTAGTPFVLRTTAAALG